MATESDSGLSLALLGEEDVNPSRLPLTKRRLTVTISVLILGFIGSSLIAYKFKNESPAPTDSQRAEVGETRTYKAIGKEEGDNSWQRVGYSVDISSDGKYVVSSSPEYDNGRGLVNLYRRLSSDSNDYVKVDSAQGVAAGTKFGQSATIDDNGNFVSVGAINENNMKGCVHTYEITNDKLVDLGQPLCGDNSYDQFGFSVSLVHSQGSDGTDYVLLGVGAPATNSNTPGYVKIYQLNQFGYWKQQGYTIRGSDGNGSFGHSVSVAFSFRDGEYDPKVWRHVIIGIPGRNQAVVNTWRNGAWTQLGPTFRFDGSNSDAGCGTSVAVDRSATKAIMGCSNYKYVGYWVWNKQNGWERVAKIEGSRTGFGYSVAMDAVASNLIIGSPNAGNNLEGEARVYYYENEFVLKSTFPGDAANDQAGYATAMSPGASYAMCGAPYATVNGKLQAGKAVVLQCDGC
jgi:hypothetical protein